MLLVKCCLRILVNTILLTDKTINLQEKLTKTKSCSNQLISFMGMPPLIKDKTLNKKKMIPIHLHLKVTLSNKKNSQAKVNNNNNTVNTLITIIISPRNMLQMTVERELNALLAVENSKKKLS